MKTYFCAIGLKNSLAKPDEFFHYKSGEDREERRRLESEYQFLPRLVCERPLGRPKAVRLIDHSECTCDRDSDRVHEECT